MECPYFLLLTADYHRKEATVSTIHFIEKVSKTTIRATIKYNYVFRQLCSLKVPVLSVPNSWVNILN